MKDEHQADLLWTVQDGSQMRESMTLTRAGDGTRSLRIPAARLRASGAVLLRITPDFGHAEKGEAGWWFSPYGYYGEWDRDDGLFRPGRDRMNMPMQFEFMDGHDRLAPGVFLTTWGDGTRLVTNYGPDAFAFEGRTVTPADFLLLESRGE